MIFGMGLGKELEQSPGKAQIIWTAESENTSGLLVFTDFQKTVTVFSSVWVCLRNLYFVRTWKVGLRTIYCFGNTMDKIRVKYHYSNYI